jgi:hypothetical protein
MAEQDRWAAKAAAFLIQALELHADPLEVAADVVPLRRDPMSGISAIELDSHTGPAPFLVYHYLLSAEATAAGSAFAEDLRVLERATLMGTPGPRLVAHRISGDEAYILATSPETYLALRGEPAPVPPPIDDPEATRREAAGALLRLLKAANDEAGRWLAATDSYEGGVVAVEEEAALKLLFLDYPSIGQLLELIQLFVMEADEQAREALGGG